MQIIPNRETGFIISFSNNPLIEATETVTTLHESNEAENFIELLQLAKMALKDDFEEKRLYANEDIPNSSRLMVALHSNGAYTVITKDLMASPYDYLDLITKWENGKITSIGYTDVIYKKSLTKPLCA